MKLFCLSALYFERAFNIIYFNLFSILDCLSFIRVCCVQLSIAALYFMNVFWVNLTKTSLGHSSPQN